MLLVFNIIFFTFNLAVLVLTLRKLLKIKRKHAILRRSNKLTWR
jgi:hypothetical protein